MSAPKSVTTSELRLSGVTLVAHVLDDGRRIIEAAGMNKFFSLMLSGELLDGEAAKAAEFIAGASQ